ncbi:MAG: hypothetical protein GX442_19785 [Candidatus Riflebacteria bacterium]|nr:hypothetical protein [Candidatus Riflebacteria bacterium]
MQGFRGGWVVALALAVAFALPGPVLADAEEECLDQYNRLLQYERQLARLLEDPARGGGGGGAKIAHLRGEIARRKAALASRFPAADLELARPLGDIRKHGRAWILTLLTQGRFTGQGKEVHAPLSPVLVKPARHQGLAGSVWRGGCGFTLMVLLSYDPVCRQAYREFLSWCEEVAGAMEKRLGRPLAYFKAEISPNEMGWDQDAFWAKAVAIAERTANRFFWDASPVEIREVTGFLALMMMTALVNQVTIDPDHPDHETLYRRSLWRKAAVPWVKDDKTSLANKFDLHHLLSHAWVVYLQLLEDTCWRGGRILSRAEQARLLPSRLSYAKARSLSRLVGFGYEVKSMKEGCGFREAAAVESLPRPLKAVAQVLGLEQVRGWEACRDIRTNERGAAWGAALFLSRGLLPFTAADQAAAIVRAWKMPACLR